MYVNRLVGVLEVSRLTIHRLLIAALVLAAKYFDDKYYNNAFYAKIGGLAVKEVNILEKEMFLLLDHRLGVTTKAMTDFLEEMNHKSLHPSCTCLAVEGLSMAVLCREAISEIVVKTDQKSITEEFHNSLRRSLQPDYKRNDLPRTVRVMTRTSSFPELQRVRVVV